MVSPGIAVRGRDFKDIMRALAERLKDLSPVMEATGDMLRSTAERNFSEGGSPQRWKPLERKRRCRVLTDAEGLRTSVNVTGSADSAWAGTDAVHAAIHQFGGRAGRGPRAEIPARPFLALRHGDVERLREAITDYVTGGVR